MTTIRNFERALGRTRAVGAAARRRGANAEGRRRDYVQRLRIYPHALREANAYYSPEKKALLFGYFPASDRRPGDHLPGGMVFTCLSHDIVAHETTHALLDGMHRRFIEPTNPDVLRLPRGVRRHRRAVPALHASRGAAPPDRPHARRPRASQNLLGELAQQFGAATGAARRAARAPSARSTPRHGKWRPQTSPTRAEYDDRSSSRTRAARSWWPPCSTPSSSIYERASADLLRIATGGTGILPAGAIHPDLVDRLADEAAKSAQHVLQHVHPRARLLPAGRHHLRRVPARADHRRRRPGARRRPDYRVAFIEAFRRRGIYPRDVRTLSVESLLLARAGDGRDDRRPRAAARRPGAACAAGRAARARPRPRERIFHARARRCGARMHGWLTGHFDDRRPGARGRRTASCGLEPQGAGPVRGPRRAPRHRASARTATSCASSSSSIMHERKRLDPSDAATADDDVRGRLHPHRRPAQRRRSATASARHRRADAPAGAAARASCARLARRGSARHLLRRPPRRRRRARSPSAPRCRIALEADAMPAKDAGDARVTGAHVPPGAGRLLPAHLRRRRRRPCTC